MKRHRYNGFHRLNQCISSSKAGAWAYARCLPHLDRAIYQCSGGRFTATSVFSGLPLVMLTTTGARTGAARTTPVLALPAPGGGDDLSLIASNWGQSNSPGWYHNLVKTPSATCTVNGGVRHYAVRQAQGEEYDDCWRLASVIYAGFAAYRHRAGNRRIPILILSCQGGA